MGRILDYFKNFKANYDAQIIRNQKMDEFLQGAHDNCIKIDGINHTMKQLGESVKQIENKVDSLQEDVNHINGRLEVIGKGTKMELFDTLYHWKKILVDDRGWALKAEKTEVENIYKIYHNELGGNGQGELYYNQIMALEEREI